MQQIITKSCWSVHIWPTADNGYVTWSARELFGTAELEVLEPKLLLDAMKQAQSAIQQAGGYFITTWFIHGPNNVEQRIE